MTGFRQTRKNPAVVAVALILAGAWTACAAAQGPVAMSQEDILLEHPSATAILVGAYSEIPGYPDGGSMVRILAYGNTDWICIAKMGALNHVAKMPCWRLHEAPGPVIREYEAYMARESGQTESDRARPAEDGR